MTKRKKQGLIILLVSVPMMWFGFSNFIVGGSNSPALSLGIAISSTLGIFFALSGLVMLVTKNSLGIWNTDDKEKKGRGELLASQTSEGSPIPNKTSNEKTKVNEMAETTRTSVELMKREKELETRRKEVVAMLKEITKEETAVVEELKSKGWVQQENGEWGIG